MSGSPRPIHRHPSEVRVTFTASEIADIARLASERQSIKDANPGAVRDMRHLDRDNTITHRIGVMGEYAVSKVLGVPMDTRAMLGGDRRGDFCISGLWCEVKTQRGWLVFNDPPTDFRADIAVLVIHELGVWDNVWVQGFIPRRDFPHVCFSDNLGHGPRKCVQPSRLAGILELDRYCRAGAAIREVSAGIRQFKHRTEQP